MTPLKVWQYLAVVASLGLWPGPTVSSVSAHSLRYSGNGVTWVILGVLATNFAFIVISAILRAIGFILPNPLRLLLVVLGGISLLVIGLRHLWSFAVPMLRRTGVLDKLSFRSLPRLFSPDNPITLFGSEADRQQDDSFLHPTKSLSPDDITPLSAFKEGLLIHATNPHTVVFFTSIFLTIVPLDEYFTRHVVLLGLWALIVDAVILSGYSWIFSIIGRSVPPDHFLHRSPIIAGVLLTALAIQKLLQVTPELTRALKQSLIGP